MGKAKDWDKYSGKEKDSVIADIRAHLDKNYGDMPWYKKKIGKELIEEATTGMQKHRADSARAVKKAKSDSVKTRQEVQKRK